MRRCGFRHLADQLLHVILETAIKNLRHVLLDDSSAQVWYCHAELADRPELEAAEVGPHHLLISKSHMLLHKHSPHDVLHGDAPESSGELASVALLLLQRCASLKILQNSHLHQRCGRCSGSCLHNFAQPWNAQCDVGTTVACQMERVERHLCAGLSHTLCSNHANSLARMCQALQEFQAHQLAEVLRLLLCKRSRGLSFGKIRLQFLFMFL
mmetsp:Transcript_89860/g.155546  ORF Transcript_89860/g.155546 Transcript_89860/m.155546 type:complete len:212 (+) Transcript_89860:1287-1922(+)